MDGRIGFMFYQSCGNRGSVSVIVLMPSDFPGFKYFTALVQFSTIIQWLKEQQYFAHSDRWSLSVA